MQMQEIEDLAKAFASARSELAQRLQELQDEQEKAKRRRLQGIKNAVVRFKASHNELREAIAGSADEFRSPKTRILHGIKVGFVKQKGKLEFTDQGVVVGLIRKHHPDQFKALVKVEETPIRKALGNLSAAELKKLGVKVTDDTDAVVVKPVDGEVDKLIDALISDPEVEATRD